MSLNRRIVSVKSRFGFRHYGVDVLIGEQLEHGGPIVAAEPIKIVYSPVEEGRIMEPTFSLELDQTQALMDELWREGFRPSAGDGSPGELGAMNRHLEDMRELVFSRRGEMKKP